MRVPVHYLQGHHIAATLANAGESVWCIYIPSTKFHAHCGGQEPRLAFRLVLEELLTRPFKVEHGTTQCRAPQTKVAGIFHWSGDFK